jgi:hypothetical protein
MTNGEWRMTNEPMTNEFVTAGVNLQFSYAAGEAASRFLIALRDEKKIYGSRCPDCRRVLVPARSFCPRCYAETREWVEVGPVGTLAAFASAPALPRSPAPALALALIRLDGADTALVHRVKANPDVLRIGARVIAVFAETRRARILDITHFEPLV